MNPTEGKLTEALLPCPFCGSVPELFSDEQGLYSLECQECTEISVEVAFQNRDKNDLIKTWNTRLESLKPPAVTTAPAPLSSEAVGKGPHANGNFCPVCRPTEVPLTPSPQRQEDSKRPITKDWLTASRIMDFQEVYIGQANSHTLSNSEISYLCRQAMDAIKLNAYIDTLPRPEAVRVAALEEVAKQARRLLGNLEPFGSQEEESEAEHALSKALDGLDGLKSE